MKVTAKFVFCMLVASGPSGFQHGFNVPYLTSLKVVLDEWVYDLDIKELQTGDQIDFMFFHISSILCLGGMIGGGLSGYIGNKLGRKGGLMLNDIIGTIGGVLSMFTKLAGTPYVLLVGRFISGINCGMNAGLSPIYLNESSPVAIRGSIGIMYQLFIVISILIAQIVSMSYLLGTDKLWIYLYLFIILTCAWQFGMFFFLPDTPKYVLQKTKDEEKSLQALQKMHGKSHDVTDYLNDIKSDIGASQDLPKLKVKEFFSQRVYLKALLLGIFLMFAQQFSGINAVLFYSSQIFSQSDLSREQAELSTVGVGTTNLVGTLVSIYLIEKMGRKSLLVVCFSGMLVFTLLLFIFLFFSATHAWASYTCIVWVNLYVFFFAIGAGPVPWVMMTELFYTSARPIGISIIVPSNWLFNYLVVIIFPVVMGVIGHYVFLIFIACQALSIAIIFLFLPETKGKTIEEITTGLKTK